MVSAAAVIVVDVVLIVAAVTTYLGGGTTSPSALTSAPHSPSRVAPTKQQDATENVATKRKPSRSASPIYHPLRVVPPETAVERSVNQDLAANSNRAAISILERTTFPRPATSSPFLAIDAVDSTSASLYAVAFTQELLDLNFSNSTWNQLLAWANYNNAPYSLTGLPASLSTKVLCTSLTTGALPVPSATEWNALATTRSNWRVSGLVVSVNPTWTQALSAGWEPVDPLMVIYDVSGALTISRPGHAPVVESIGFALTVGGASLHPGYGVVALDDWTVN